MGLTVQDIFTRIQRTFGDEAQAQLTQADVLRWINDAQREIAVANNSLQVKTTASSVAQQQAYSLPVGILRLHSVRYNGLALESRTLEQMDELIGTMDQTVAQGYPTGTPQYYYVWAGQINLYPAPDSPITNGLTIYYTREPVQVAALSDTPELPDQYHNRIVEYCLARAYELDENLFAANMAEQKFATGVAALKQDESEKVQEFYPFITSPAVESGGWDEGGWW